MISRLLPGHTIALLPHEALASAFQQHLNEAEAYGVLPRVSKAWGRRISSSTHLSSVSFTLTSPDAVAGFLRWMQAHGLHVRQLSLSLVQIHDWRARQPVWAALAGPHASNLRRLQLSLPRGQDSEQLLRAVFASNPQLLALHLHYDKHSSAAAAATCFCCHFSAALWQGAALLEELRTTGSCVTRVCSTTGIPSLSRLTLLELGCCDTTAPAAEFCSLLAALPALRSLSYSSGTPLHVTPMVCSRIAAHGSNLTSLQLHNFHAGAGGDQAQALRLLASSLKALQCLQLVNCSGLGQLVQLQRLPGGLQGPGLSRLAVMRSQREGFLPAALTLLSDPVSDSDSDSDLSDSDSDSSGDAPAGSSSSFGDTTSNEDTLAGFWNSMPGTCSPSSCSSMEVVGIAAPRTASWCIPGSNSNSSGSHCGAESPGSCSAGSASSGQCCSQPAATKGAQRAWMSGLLLRAAELPALLELDLSGLGLKTIAPLCSSSSSGSLAQLTSLKLGPAHAATSSNQLDYLGLAGISSLQALQHLDLSHNRLCSASLQHLVGLSLSHLSLAGNKLSMCCRAGPSSNDCCGSPGLSPAGSTGSSTKCDGAPCAAGPRCPLWPLASMAASLVALDVSGCNLSGGCTLGQLTNLTCLRAGVAPNQLGRGTCNTTTCSSSLQGLQGQLQELQLGSVVAAACGDDGGLRQLAGVTKLVLQDPSGVACVFHLQPDTADNTARQPSAAFGGTAGSLPHLRHLGVVLSGEQVVPAMRALAMSCSNLRSLSAHFQDGLCALPEHWSQSLTSLSALTALSSLAVPVPSDLGVLAGCTSLCKLLLLCPGGPPATTPAAEAACSPQTQRSGCSPGSDCCKPVVPAAEPAPCSAGACCAKQEGACCAKPEGACNSDMLQALQQLHCADWGPCKRYGELQGMRCLSREELVSLQALRRLGSMHLSHACLQEGAADALPHVQITVARGCRGLLAAQQEALACLAGV